MRREHDRGRFESKAERNLAEGCTEIATACDVPSKVQYRALELARTAESAGIANGRNLAGVAAACVYVAAHEQGRLRTQSTVADTAGVSVPTLRARRDELQNVLEG